MQCPKCPGRLNEAQTEKGAKYRWCTYCKGLWIGFSDLLKIFDTEKFKTKLNSLKLVNPMPTRFECPQCTRPLQVGQMPASQLNFDECSSCRHFFFDEKEINELFDYLSGPVLPRAEDLTVLKDNVRKLETFCPVCKDQHLWGTVKDPEKLQACLKCEGILTTAEALNSITSKSLFSSKMFTFRHGQGVISICRFCQHEQEPRRSDCIKCGREISRLTCGRCQSQMSEYSLNDTTIERCQICNTVWLDKNEFERIMTALPDVRKAYEEGRRRGELLETEVKAASHVYAQAIEETTRDSAIRFWGRFGVFFFD